MNVPAILLAAKGALGNSSLFAKWKRDNPNEYQRVESYWKGGTAFPQTATAFGLHYALDAQAYLELTAELPFIPV